MSGPRHGQVSSSRGAECKSKKALAKVALYHVTVLHGGAEKAQGRGEAYRTGR